MRNYESNCTEDIKKTIVNRKESLVSTSCHKYSLSEFNSVHFADLFFCVQFRALIVFSLFAFFLQQLLCSAKLSFFMLKE